MVDRETADGAPDLGRVDVDPRHQLEVVVVQLRVGCQRLTQPAHTDDDDVPLSGEAQDAAQLALQGPDRVTAATSAEAAEVRQVLAHLESRDVSLGSQVIR